MHLLRRLWTEDAPFDWEGEFYKVEAAFTSVKPVHANGIPMFFGGASGAGDRDRRANTPTCTRSGASRVPPSPSGCATSTPRWPRSAGTMRYSLSIRPIIADTEAEAWDKAAVDRRAGRAAHQPGQGADERRRRRATPASAEPRNATYSVERATSMTNSEGRKRLIAMSAESDVFDERLWMRIANLTGAAGNSTALVGTPEQVADAMLKYYEMGIGAFILKGFDPVPDAADYGKRLLPLVREGAAKIDAAR